MQLPSKPLASTAVVAMGLLWAVMGGALLMSIEFLSNPTTKCVFLWKKARAIYERNIWNAKPEMHYAVLCRLLYMIVSPLCLLIGVTTTHGLGGQLLHASPKEVGEEVAQRWRFFQPFQ